MSIISIIFTAIGLSMDAFAVSITNGLRCSRCSKNKIALRSGIYFGGFQALMALLGWLLGIKFTKYIEKFDHWIAFILLVLIGGRMLIEALKGGETDDEGIDLQSHKRFILLAIATSIDSLAVGVSFAFLNINILLAVSLIGIITFIFCVIAVYIGEAFGKMLSNKAEIIGGVILIIIGINILVNHLGLLKK